MAATKLIPMHQNKGRSITQCLKDRTDYAKNGEKTEDGKYISAYACDPDYVENEFAISKEQYLRLTHRVYKGDIIAYQIRQSFKPGEITPKEANEIGYETAMKLTKGNHAFIVATHTDKAHIHNHVIFNSTSLDCTRKFRNFWLSTLVLQRISDLICLEHGLSVIKPVPYRDRQKRTEYPNELSFRDKIKDEIDLALAGNPESFEDLLRQLAQKDYEIKRGKYTAVRGKEQKRFIRFRSLGEDYSEENLKRVIAGEAKIPEREKKVTKRKAVKAPEKKFDMLIDIQEKMRQGKNDGYIWWAKGFNVTQMAEALLFLNQHGIRDMETLRQMADASSAKYRELTETIKSAEEKMAANKILKTHIINYRNTKETYVQYRKSGYSKKFFEAHRDEILLHKAAKEAFSKLPDGKIPKVKELNAEFAELLALKKSCYTEYKKAKAEMREYQIAKQNVESFYQAQQTSSLSVTQKKKHQQEL